MAVKVRERVATDGSTNVEDVLRIDRRAGVMRGVVGHGQGTTFHAHHDEEFLTITAGTARLVTSNGTVQAHAGETVHIPRFEAHSIQNDSGTDPVRYVSTWFSTSEIEASVLDRSRKRLGEADKVFVTATPPTPNGGLHLGHLSGPYLAADIVARNLRAFGIDVTTVCGADTNQSYVELKAGQTGETSAAVAAKFEDAMVAALRHYQMAPDVWYSPPRSACYEDHVAQFFRRLKDAGHIAERISEEPWCGSCERFLSCASIRGRCVHCGEIADGNSCEACALPSHASQLVDAHCRICGGVPELRSTTISYFSFAGLENELRGYWSRCVMPPRMRSMCEQFMALGCPDFDVAFPQPWGLALPDIFAPELRLYAWAEMGPGYLFGYHQAGALSPKTSVEVVQCFGFDNAFFHAVLFPAMYMASGDTRYLPTAFLCNEFYTLDGAKFSTSRGHAVWALDWVGRVPADHVRYYLAKTRPAPMATDFRVESFVAETNAFFASAIGGWLEESGAALAAYDWLVPEPGLWREEQIAFAQAIASLPAAVGEALRLRSDGLAEAVALLERFVASARTFLHLSAALAAPALASERRTAVALAAAALLAFAEAAAPIVPELAARLNAALGVPARTRVPATVHCRLVEAGTDVSSIRAIRYHSITETALARTQHEQQ